MMTRAVNRRGVLKIFAGVAGAAVMAPALIGRADEAKAGAAATASASDVANGKAPNPFADAKIGIRNVAGNVNVLMNAGGNIATFHGKDGLIVVDAGIPQKAKDLVKALRGVTDGPPKVLVNTHWHFDHVGGNGEVAAAGATVVAHENTYTRMSTKQKIEFMQMDMEPAAAGALPVVTFAEKSTLRLNGETIELTHIAPAHTDTDVVVYFKDADVLHTGDLMFNGMWPFIDYSSGGSLTGMIAAADALIKMAGPKTKIIPGHGPVGTVEDLKTFREMLATVQGAIQPLVKAGKSVDEIVAEKPLAKWDDKWGKGFLDTEKFTKLVAIIETKGR